MQQNVPTGQSTYEVTMPMAMCVYGESVSLGTRMSSIAVCCFQYNNSYSTKYKIGYANGSGGKTNIQSFVILIGS